VILHNENVNQLMSYVRIMSWPIPKNVKEIRRFLGTCSYYRKFIQNFAKIANPLHRLTEKNVIFHWNIECDQAFNTLKKALTTSPILTYPCLEKDFILDTDASGTGVGAVLSQTGEDGKEHVHCNKYLTFKHVFFNHGSFSIFIIPEP